MKKIIMFGAAGILAMSLLAGLTGGTTVNARAGSRRCNVVKSCRVTGRHHSRKHHPKKHYSKKHYPKKHHASKHHSKTYHCVSRHSGHHNG